MTWEEWVESEYNINNKFGNGDYYIFDYNDNDYRIEYSYCNFVIPEDVIELNHNYSIGGAGACD